jgi:hypothetical protein
MSHPISSFDPAIDPVLPEDNFDQETEEVLTDMFGEGGKEEVKEFYKEIPKVYTPHTSGLKNWWVKVMQPLTFIDWK